MKSRFEPDKDLAAKPGPSPELIDPEAYDQSEERFFASVEEKPAAPRFVVDPETEAGDAVADVKVAAFAAPRAALEGPSMASGQTQESPISTSESISQTMPPLTPAPGVRPADLREEQAPDSWRQEVAARVNRYRTRRRTRGPRYPSLQLRFEPTDSSWSSPSAPTEPAAAISGQLAFSESNSYPEAHADSHAEAATPALAAPPSTPEVVGKILEFPRSFASSPIPGDELAEPVFVQPRILEVPEVLPPPPALGGILIEPPEGPATERRPGFELPLQAPPLARRILAGAIDGLLVLIGFVLFAYIFFRIASYRPPPWQAITASAPVVAAFWAGFQYLFLVYAATTPGLRLSRLRLSRFDGTAVPRAVRRWRVLASLLSGLSLALGYAWCFLDEDELCWHDRITRTYMAPTSAE